MIPCRHSWGRSGIRTRYETIKTTFDETNDKSSEICGRPKGPEIIKEMEESIKTRRSDK